MWISDSTKEALQKAHKLSTKGLNRRALTLVRSAVPFGYDEEEQEMLMRAVERYSRLIGKAQDGEMCSGLGEAVIHLRGSNWMAEVRGAL